MAKEEFTLNIFGLKSILTYAERLSLNSIIILRDRALKESFHTFKS